MSKIITFLIVTALAYWLLMMGGMKLVCATLNDAGISLPQTHKKAVPAAHVDSAKSALWRNNAGLKGVEEKVDAE